MDDGEESDGGRERERVREEKTLEGEEVFVGSGPLPKSPVH
jgi:hypothetical protein